MTIDYVDHQPKIAEIRYGAACPARAERAIRQRIKDAKSDVCSRIHQLTDDTLHRAAIYLSGGLVADGAVLAVRNVGPEHHTWWSWLVIGVPLIWLSFLGLVALTFAALRVVVGALGQSLSWTTRVSAQAGVAVPECVDALAGVFVDLVGPGAIRPTELGREPIAIDE